MFHPAMHQSAMPKGWLVLLSCSTIKGDPVLHLQVCAWLRASRLGYSLWLRRTRSRLPQGWPPGTRLLSCSRPAGEQVRSSMLGTAMESAEHCLQHLPSGGSLGVQSKHAHPVLHMAIALQSPQACRLACCLPCHSPVLLLHAHWTRSSMQQFCLSPQVLRQDLDG